MNATLSNILLVCLIAALLASIVAGGVFVVRSIDEGLGFGGTADPSGEKPYNMPPISEQLPRAPIIPPEEITPVPVEEILPVENEPLTDCPEIEATLSPTTREMFTIELSDEWIDGWQPWLLMPGPNGKLGGGAGPTMLCSKGSRTGENINNIYCRGEQEGWQAAFMTRRTLEDGTVVGNYYKLFTVVYDSEQNYIETICGEEMEY